MLDPTGVTVHTFGASTVPVYPTLWLGRGTPRTHEVDVLDEPLGGVEYGSGQTTTLFLGGDALFSFEDTLFVAARISSWPNTTYDNYLCGSSELSGRNASIDAFLCEGSTCLWEEWASKQDHPFVGVVLSGAECGNLSVHIITPALELMNPTTGSLLCGGVPAWSQVGSGRALGSNTTRPGPSAHPVSPRAHSRKLVRASHMGRPHDPPL